MADTTWSVIESHLPKVVAYAPGFRAAVCRHRRAVHWRGRKFVYLAERLYVSEDTMTWTAAVEGKG